MAVCDLLRSLLIRGHLVAFSNSHWPGGMKFKADAPQNHRLPARKATMALVQVASGQELIGKRCRSRVLDSQGLGRLDEKG